MKRTRSEYEPAFLDIHGVARRYNVKPATIWAWMDQGTFPQPIRLTGGCSRWPLDDLKAFEDELRAERCARHEWEEMQRRKRRHDKESA